MSILPLNQGGTGSDLSATGGTSQVVKQTSTGAVLTVGQLATADIPGVLSPKNLNNIRFASQFPGTDLGMKINNADADLGSASGEIWVDASAGSTISTPVVLGQFHILRFIDQPVGGYSVAATIQLGAAGKYGAGMVGRFGGVNAVLGPVSLVQASGANLSAMIWSAGPQSFIDNIILDGNKAGNPTGGTILLVKSTTTGVNSAWRQTFNRVTVQNGPGFGVMQTSTGTSNEVAATKYLHISVWNCELGGMYIKKSTDTTITQDSEVENNGFGGGGFSSPGTAGIYNASAWPIVSTSGTAVTWTGGAKWTTDSSIVGRTVSINNVRYVVAGVSSTTSLTLATSAGTQTNVVMRGGFGIECYDTRGPNLNVVDVSGNSMSGIMVTGDSTSSIGSQFFLAKSCSFGSNIERDIEILNYDTALNGYGNLILDCTFVGHNVVAGANGEEVYIQDSQSNLIANNQFYGYNVTYGLRISETVSGRIDNPGQKDVVGDNQYFGAFTFAAIYFQSLHLPIVAPTNPGSATFLNSSLVISPSANTTPILELYDTTPSQTTPRKYLISAGGQFKIANDALSINILTLTDAGALNVTGGYSDNGTAGVSAGPFSSITAITAKGGIVTQLTGTSDERLKKAKKYEGGLAEVEAITPIKFKWNDKGQKHTGISGEKEFIGFSAQNVQAVIPEAITATEKSSDGKEEYLSFDDRPIIAALVNAVKKVAAENKKLQERLAKLEKK